jgi:hypothetical protein
MMCGAAALLSLCLSATAETSVEAKSNAKKKSWESFPTRTLDDLSGFKPAQIPLTKFGGRADRREKATGFFRAEKIGDRWWMVDPEGGLYLNVAVVGVSPRNKYGSKAAFGKLFGDDAHWADATLGLLRDHGFNGTGGWSDVETIRAAKNPAAYTVSMGLAAGFGKKLGAAFQQPGHTGFVSDCIPSLHPDFPAYCDEQCAKLAAAKDDPWRIGYFSDNEMPGNLKMLDNMISLSDTNATLMPMRKAARAWLAARGRDAKSISDEDRAAFLGYVYSEYLRITTAAIRRADPNHLCLGPRFHSPVRERREVWEAAGKYLDVIAMNYYGTWTPRASDLENWAKWSGKPCVITEFYTKGADTPLANSTGAGWLVKTQKDRGLFYQNYVLALLESKSCVGWHWFKYMDNDPTDMSVDPSNRDSNKGIVTIAYDPYDALLEQMKPVNQNVYSLADYFDAKK